MTPQYFLPLATYPDPSSGLIISNAVAFAEFCGASLNVCAQSAQIPHISHAWSSLLLDTPEMIERAESLSRDRAATLIAAAENLGANAKIKLSTRTLKIALPLLHETAATQARFFDLDGPLLLARDRDHGLRYDESLVYPPDAALWG